jgi:hypothetical protein
MERDFTISGLLIADLIASGLASAILSRLNHSMTAMNLMYL